MEVVVSGDIVRGANLVEKEKTRLAESIWLFGAVIRRGEFSGARRGS